MIYNEANLPYVKCIKHKLISTLSADNTENGAGVRDTVSSGFPQKLEPAAPQSFCGHARL